MMSSTHQAHGNQSWPFQEIFLLSQNSKERFSASRREIEWDNDDEDEDELTNRFPQHRPRLIDCPHGELRFSDSLRHTVSGAFKNAEESKGIMNAHGANCCYWREAFSWLEEHSSEVDEFGLLRLIDALYQEYILFLRDQSDSRSSSSLSPSPKPRGNR